MPRCVVFGYNNSSSSPAFLCGDGHSGSGHGPVRQGEGEGLPKRCVGGILCVSVPYRFYRWPSFWSKRRGGAVCVCVRVRLYLAVRHSGENGRKKRRLVARGCRLESWHRHHQHHYCTFVAGFLLPRVTVRLFCGCQRPPFEPDESWSVP